MSIRKSTFCIVHVAVDLASIYLHFTQGYVPCHTRPECVELLLIRNTHIFKLISTAMDRPIIFSQQSAGILARICPRKCGLVYEDGHAARWPLVPVTYYILHSKFQLSDTICCGSRCVVCAPYPRQTGTTHLNSNFHPSVCIDHTHTHMYTKRNL